MSGTVSQHPRMSAHHMEKKKNHYHCSPGATLTKLSVSVSIYCLMLIAILWEGLGALTKNSRKKDAEGFALKLTFNLRWGVENSWFG